VAKGKIYCRKQHEYNLWQRVKPSLGFTHAKAGEQ